MASLIPASEFRRSDWNWSGRTQPMIEAMLGNLEKERDPLERQGIVDRLTRYVKSFSEDQVDFAHLNAGLVKAGFTPLPHASSQLGKRSPSEMHPNNRAALDRADRFYGYEIPTAARFGSPESKARLAQLERLVRSSAGDQMSEEEFRYAMSMLSMASQR